MGWRTVIFLAAAGLAGCGSSSPTTVTVHVNQPSAKVQSTPTTTERSSEPPVVTTPAHATRTESEPEFVERHTEGLAGAAATVRSRGYTPTDESQYHPNQTLRVLVGARDGKGGYDQLAFFFIGDRYIGTDVKVPSAKIQIAGQGESAVTVSYPLYRPGDMKCCASGGSARVTFALENGHLAAMQTIPPLSRRNPDYQP